MVTDRLGQQFGNYRLVSLLGQGGYAEVYLGQHVRLDLQAAIKVLHTHLTGSEAEHFQQEAQTIARLAHPSIVRVFDFDVQDGAPFLVMDYAPNGSLRQRYPRGSLVPIPQIVSFVKQVARALQYAHDKKYIHRDVKPENMLIGQHQEVLLSDFGIADGSTVLKDLQVGSFDSAWLPDVGKVPQYQRLTHFTSTTPPTSADYEALYFNFHNTVLASQQEVRRAIAMAIDHQALIQEARHGLATLLCTDHGSFYHPGYEAQPPCPDFNPEAANKLLDDNGWVRGPDGVRTRGGERLEFEYSAAIGRSWRVDGEVIIARNLQAIGIKIDIQNYPIQTFFSFLAKGEASPPSGAVSGRYDIAEFANNFTYDPDDSGLLSCDQIPPKGFNIDFYCNHTLDALYTKELTTVDRGLRQQVFIQIHDIYLTDSPFITLYSATENWMVRKGTHNYQPSPLAGETVNIWQWWCDNGKC